MAYTQAAVISVGVIFPAIGFVLVCLRFWMRITFQKTYIGADDWLILAASILVIGMAVDAILATFIGVLGMDGQSADPSRDIAEKKLDYSTLVIEKIAYGAIKLSVLFFYRRIFTVKKFQRINTCLIVLIVAWTIAFFFVDVFSCGAHPEANWDPVAKAKYHCINLFEMLLVFAVTDVLTDIAILWMPYPQIKKLHISQKEKWGLAGIFMLGTIDLIVGIIRLGFIIANQTIPAVNTNFNPPDQTAPTFWTILEVGVGVIAANLPALAPLFRDKGSRMGSAFSSMRKKLTLSHKSSYDGTTGMNITQAFGMASEKGTRPASVHEGATAFQAKRKSEHVGMWDQFERTDETQSHGSEEIILRPERVV